METLPAVVTSSVQAVLTIGAAVLLAMIVRLSITFVVTRLTWLTNLHIETVVLEEITRPLYVSIILVGIYLTIPLLAPPTAAFVAEATILTILVLIWARAGIRFFSRSLVALREHEKDPEFAPVLKNLWTFMVVLITFALFLSIWGIDVTPFLAGAGVAGIIVGIAAQDTIGNFFAGLSLNLDKTYEVGDMLQLEDGTRGTVTNISIRSTSILTRDNIEVTIPNSYLNSTQVINESTPVRRRRIRLDVGVAYGSDLELVEQVLLDVAIDSKRVLNTPSPEVRFRSFDDSAIRAQLQCYINHPAEWGRVRHNLIKAIAIAFADAEIKIPFPQRELTFFEAENEIRVANQSNSAHSDPQISAESERQE